MDVKFDQTLPCSKCIRGGYNYVYNKSTEPGDTEQVRNIQDPSEDYDGNCALMKFDGTFTYDGTTEIDLTGEITSYGYTDVAVAISNCPAKEDICGTKEIALSDSSSFAAVLETKGMDNKVDSCHWVVSSSCDVPEILLSEDYQGTSSNYSILVVEWSEDSTSAQALTFVNDKYLPVEAMSAYEMNVASFPPATLPSAVYTDSDGVASTVYGYLIEEDIAMKKEMYDAYALEVDAYLEEKAIWEDAVVALKDHYKKVDDPDQDAGEAPTLPPMPVVPTLPDPYDGPVLDDLTFPIGYGEITSSFMVTHVGETGDIINPFPRKYFGLMGQGLADDEGMGFDVNKDVPGIDGSAQTCSKRYFSVNLIPEEDSDILLTSDVVSVKSYANSMRDLDQPEEPTEPSAPSADPTRAEGAKYLASAVSVAATLAALTLY
jgi:hypothetical protein